MFIGIGINIHPGSAGSGPSTPAFSLTAPDPVVWVSGPEVAQAVFAIGAPVGTVEGMRVYGQSSLSPTVGADGKFTSVLEEVFAPISAADEIDLQIDDFAFAPFTPNGAYYVLFWIANSGGTQISPVSDVITETIAATVTRQTITFSPIFGGLYMNENGTRQAQLVGVYMNEGHA